MSFLLLAIALLVITLKHVTDFHYRIAFGFVLAALVIWVFGFFTHWRYADASSPVERSETAVVLS